MKIEDNFLEQKVFYELKSLLMGVNLPWYYNPIIDSADDIDKFQFVHRFYEDFSPRSEFIGQMNPILDIIKPISLCRIKANLLTRTSNIIENLFHVDIGNLENSPEKLKQWTTSIFYVNTNDGYTKFEDGSVVESVANRMVTFPADMKHTGTSCTDEKRRIVINFNYFEH